MKKLLYLFVAVGMTAFTACSDGEDGAPGPDAQVYEITDVNFTEAGNYGVFFTFPSGNVLPSDHILVYRLSGVDQGADVWKPLPETYYFDDGTLDFMYGFDHTQYDVNIYMDGFDLGGINGDYRLNQVFRIVSIPGYFANKGASKVDLSDYNAVVKAFKIDESKMVTLTPKAKS